MRQFAWLFALGFAVLVFASANAADDGRTIWKYDKGTFEKQPDGKWIQKEGNTTHEYTEKHNLPGDIEIFDAKRKISVRLKTGDALVTQQGKKGALEKLKGEWVTADGAKLVNKFTLWKYEKGSFERQADGKWIQKEGDKTYTLREDARLLDHTSLYDTTRKIAFRLTKDSAEVFVAGKGAIDKFKGEWDFTAKPLAKGDPKAKPKNVGRTAWQYDKGTFLKTEGNRWVHVFGKMSEEYEEVLAKVGYIELQDRDRGVTVKLMRDSASVQVGLKGKPLILKGEWVDPETVSKDIAPKKVEFTGKSDKGHFAEVSSYRRTEQVGGLALAPSPDGKKVALLHGAAFQGQFGIYDIETKKYDPSWKLPNYPLHVVWSADGSTLAVESPSTELKNGKMSKVFVWDTKTWEQKAEFDFDAVPFSLVLSADGNVVGCSGPMLEKGHLIKVWDVKAKKELLSQNLDSNSANLALTANGKVLAVSGTGPMKDQVGFLDLTTNKPRGAMKCRPEYIMSGDGNTIVEWVNGGDNVAIAVWNTKAVAKGPRVLKLTQWKADKFAFINKDQHLVISGGWRQDEVKVFDLKTLTEYDSIKLSRPKAGLARKFMQIQPSSGSSHLLIYATGDELVRVWSTPWGPKDSAPMPKEKGKP
jgi:WD40 repeat protein